MSAQAIRIPLSSPDVEESDIQAVAEVLRTPRLSLGPRLEEFEHEMAKYLGAAHAVAVSSGTAALHLCIRTLGIGEGDEVIVPSFAFVAVANAVRYERAIPVFVDIEPQTLNLDPTRIEAAISPRTRAILLVHTFGLPADLHAIIEIARRRDLFVIEDACEAIGAEYHGRKVGIQGDVGVFAFYPNKQITTGEGGMLVTQNPDIARLARRLRNHGRDGTLDWFEHTELGYNYRLSEVNCTLGIGQLKRIESTLARRETVAAAYQKRLGNHGCIVTPALQAPRCKISWFVYVVRLADDLGRVHRDWIARELRQRGIETGRYFAPIHMQPAYRTATDLKLDLRTTEAIATRTLALPFFNRIQREQIDEVSQALLELSPRVGGIDAR